MQTHPDRDAVPSEALANLMKRAAEIEARGERNAITAGNPGEPVLMDEQRFGVNIVRRPDDPDCLRVSIGEIRDADGVRYLVFRGDPAACVALLQRATRALESVTAASRASRGRSAS